MSSRPILKILQISTNWAGGGPGGVEKDLYYYLKSLNEECIIAYGRDGISADIPSIRIGSPIGIRIDYALSHIFDNAGFNSRKATIELINRIKEYNPDIIQIHNLLGYYINVEILFDYLRLSNIPVVWTLHDCWAFTGHCINFERIDCKKWENNCHDCQLVRSYPESWIFDRSYSNYQKKERIFTGINNLNLVTPSNWLAKLVSQSFLRDYPLFVLPNGIDTEVFQPRDNSLREKFGIGNKKIVLFVASVWNEMKGINLIPKIVDGLGEDYTVVVIGKKDDSIIPSKVISLQRTNNAEELAEWYSTADVFVNPTFGDNFPTVNIEALACGTPVVTNNTGGSPESAGNDYGRIVYSKTAEEIVEKIQAVVSENISSHKCRERALFYSRDHAYRRYYELYKRIMAERMVLESE